MTDELIEKMAVAALNYMPSLTDRKITIENGIRKEELTVCPPFEFLNKFLKPAMADVLEIVLANTNKE